MQPITYYLSLVLISVINSTAISLQSITNPIITGVTNLLTNQITDNTIEPSISNVMKYTNYAAAVLCTDASLQSWSCKPCQNIQGTSLVTTFSNTLLGTKAYLAINNNEQAIILSFRGTEDLQNWLNDVELVQVPFSSINSIGPLVHGGFLDAMESVSSSFLGALKTLIQNQQYTNYKIRVVGHSLGGAMASLAAIKIKDKLNLSWDKLELYTYGQPRTGNVQFAEWFDALPITVARSVNYNDPVPRLPPRLTLNYSHHLNELFINGLSASYCSTSVLEDPNCALSTPDTELDVNAHLTYYNVSLSASTAC